MCTLSMNYCSAQGGLDQKAFVTSSKKVQTDVDGQTGMEKRQKQDKVFWMPAIWSLQK
jgi:hypothetical protein